MDAAYEYLDVEVTLRCDAFCPNCIKFSNMEKVTGLDYSQTDMTEEQVLGICKNLRDVAVASGIPAVQYLCLTGGEPTVHPMLPTFLRMFRELLMDKVILHLSVNSNLLHSAAPEVAPWIVNWSTIPQKHLVHNTALVHPFETNPGKINTFSGCTHYRKWRPVVSVYGYSMCCAADGYIRLFNLNELVIPNLPNKSEGFPLDKMDSVCCHCPFGAENQLMEKDVGRPVSVLYQLEAVKNHAGRQPAQYLT